MRPIRLLLEGFAGIASGQAKNRIEINFDALLNKNDRIVALTGPNGAGKSTIMDNMHPYRVMPSRSSAPTPNAFSFYDNLVEGADGLKELDFEHAGKIYRSMVRMKAAGKTKKQEAYLFTMVDGVATAYVDTTTGLASDGKADSYDKCIESLLGKPEVFFTSIFGAQGKTPISSMSAGDVKGLLSAMMGMQSIKAFADKASDVVKALKPHLAAIQSQSLPLQQMASQEEIYRARYTQIGAKISEQSEALTVCDQTIKKCVAELATMQTLALQQETLRAQRSAMTQQLQSAKSETAFRTKQFDAGQTSARSSAESRIQDLQGSKLQSQALLDQANKALSECKALMAREPNLQVLRKESIEVRSEISSLRMKLDDIVFDEQRLHEINQSVAALRDALATSAADGKNLAEILAAAKATAALISEVPCAGHAFASSCKLLESARTANSGIAPNETRMMDMRKSYRADLAKSGSLQAEIEALLKVQAKVTELRAKETSLNLRAMELKAALADVPRIEQAKLDQPLLQAALERAANECRTVQERATNAKQELDALKALQAGERQQFIAMVESDILRLQKALADLAQPVDSGRIFEAQGAVTSAENSKLVVERIIEDLREQHQNASIELKKSMEANKDVHRIQLRADRVSSEMSQWTLLSRALGNDGIIAMSIDDAGPSISAICNQLLGDCYGGRFCVRISTQDRTATGVLKESFVIHVEDTLRGERKTLDDMSGGEKVWINECLVRSMALYMAQAASNSFATLFSDETDGPLDETRKRQFMAMKRAVLDIGGFEREYIITQTPALWDLCDATLDVTSIHE
jgi:exonuclease SbcC